MALRHARAHVIAIGLVAVGIGTVGAGTTSASGTRPAVPTVYTATFTVNKLLDDAPASWPITAALESDSGLGFAPDGAPTSTRTTDSAGSATYTIVATGEGVPEGVRIELTEPRRSDGTLTRIYCGYPEAQQTWPVALSPGTGDGEGSGWIDEPTRTGGWFTLPAFAIDGLVCDLHNEGPATLTLTKHLDGGAAPVAGFDLAALSETEGLSVGTGTTFDDDGLFASSSAGGTDVNLAFSSDLLYFSEGPPFGLVLAGEALRAGHMLTSIVCTGDEREQVPALAADSDSPLFLVDGPHGTQVVGEYLDFRPGDHWDCDIDNAAAGLTATKTASVTAPTPGSSFTYTITATNSGNTPLLGATLNDPIPSGLTATAASASSGTCTVSAGQVDCALGDMAIGATRTVTVGVTVGAGVTDGQAMLNQATVVGQVPAWDPALVVLGPNEAAVTAPTTPISAVAAVSVAASVPTTTTTEAPTTTTTTIAPTTTIAVAQAAPTTTVFVPVVSPATLPRTGGSTHLLPIALWTSGAGAVLLTLRRLRRRAA